MKFIFSTILILTLFTPTFGQASEIPVPTGYTVPDDLKNEKWHKWQINKFTILSLNETQGKFLFNNIEKMKLWALTRWGLPNEPFSSECRIVCVPNKKLMKQLFGLDKTAGEVRRDDDGNIKRIDLWLVLDGTPSETVLSALTLACINELEQQRKIKLGFWVHRGMILLNGTVPQIKEELIAAEMTFKSEEIFAITEEEWLGQSPEERDLFDSEAAMVCLLFRKEFGQANLMRFLRTGSSEENLERVFGFENYTKFDVTLKRYIFHLSNDISHNKTPANYLKIKPLVFRATLKTRKE